MTNATNTTSNQTINTTDDAWTYDEMNRFDYNELLEDCLSGNALRLSSRSNRQPRISPVYLLPEMSQVVANTPDSEEIARLKATVNSLSQACALNPCAEAIAEGLVARSTEFWKGAKSAGLDAVAWLSELYSRREAALWADLQS
jgi:hypothetical protein